jgi:energy-coupling factor transporter ATP-binding protein EcfA2
VTGPSSGLSGGRSGPDFQALKPILGPRASALEHAWLTADRAEQHEIEIVTELLARRATTERSVLLHPPTSDQADGPIRLGRILHGRNPLGHLGLTESELTQHIGVFGRSGSGKSTLCLNILLQLIDRNIPWLVFDHKRSTRSLLSIPTKRPIRVVTLGRDTDALLRFNIMVPPPGLTPDVHQRRLIELIASTWYTGDGVISLLERAFTTAYRQAAPNWPTIADVRTIVEDMPAKSRELLWKTSANRVLTQLTTGQLGRILNTRQDDLALHALLTEHTVIELDGLAVNDTTLIVSSIITHLTHQLLASPPREQLRMLCLIEEAHHLLPKRDTTSHESTLETTLREGREIGLSVMLADQCISAIAPTALANCFTTVCLNTRHRSDLTAASGSLLLDEPRKHILSLLPVGQAVVRLSDRWPHPVHIAIDELPITKGSVTDDHIRTAHLNGPFSMHALDQLHEHRNTQTHSTHSPVSAPNSPNETPSADVPPRPPHAIPTQRGDSHAVSTASPHPPQKTLHPPRPPPRAETPSSHTDPHAHRASEPAAARPAPEAPQPQHRPQTRTRPSKAPVDGPGEDALDHAEWPGEMRALLESVAREPLLAVTARFEALGLSRRKGTACKTALVDEGMVRAVDLITPTGRTVLLGLTDDGRRWCGRRDIAVAPVHGSLVHAWWQRRAADLLRSAGWEVQIEQAVGGGRAPSSSASGHAFDVVAERDGRRALLEVETGKSDYLSNLVELERTPADARAVLWLDPASHRRIESVAGRVRVLRPAALEGWVKGL